MGIGSRKIVIINQAANYLTVGYANAFAERMAETALITGSVHVQGEDLSDSVSVSRINRWHERPPLKKAGSYVLALIRMWILLITKYRKYEVLFVSVPPMGYLLNLLLPHRFSMLIWDVYPDVLKVTGMRSNSPVYRAWSRMNRVSFRRAARIFTISDNLAVSLSEYVDRSKVSVNPIWSIFQENGRIAKDENPFIRKHGLTGKFVVQYSGNIGVTHNVETLIQIAEELIESPHIVVQIIGRGPRLPTIERLVADKALSNVQLLPFQSDADFPYSLSAADLGVVILHESVSQGSVPSKAYNLMSFGIPGLYIASADSELSRLAMAHEHGECFRAADTESAADFIRELASDEDRQLRYRRHAESAARHYRRDNADKLVESYLRAD